MSAITYGIYLEGYSKYTNKDGHLLCFIKDDDALFFTNYDGYISCDECKKDYALLHCYKSKTFVNGEKDPSCLTVVIYIEGKEKEIIFSKDKK